MESVITTSLYDILGLQRRATDLDVSSVCVCYVVAVCVALNSRQIESYTVHDLSSALPHRCAGHTGSCSRSHTRTKVETSGSLLAYSWRTRCLQTLLRYSIRSATATAKPPVTTSELLCIQRRIYDETGKVNRSAEEQFADNFGNGTASILHVNHLHASGETELVALAMQATSKHRLHSLSTLPLCLSKSQSSKSQLSKVTQLALM